MADRSVPLITNTERFTDATAVGRKVNSLAFIDDGTVQTIDATGIVRTIPTTGTSAPTTLIVADTATAGVTTVLALVHALESGTPTAGIGTRLDYYAECVGGPVPIGSLSFLTTDVGSGTVTSEFRVKTRIGGSLADRFKVDSLGNLCPSLDDTYDAGKIALRWRAGYFSVSVMAPVLSTLVGSTETPVASLDAPAGAETYLQLASNVSGQSPSLSAISATDADVNLTFSPKGAGTLSLAAGSTGSVQIGGHATAKVGAFNVTPVTRRTVPTGSSTDAVIVALQQLGFFSQT